jgi:hypothetical protein
VVSPRRFGVLHQKNWQSQYNWNIVESDIKHNSLNPLISSYWSVDVQYSILLSSVWLCPLGMPIIIVLNIHMLSKDLPIFVFCFMWQKPMVDEVIEKHIFAGIKAIVFNVTFNNISVILWLSVFLINRKISINKIKETEYDVLIKQNT